MEKTALMKSKGMMFLAFFISIIFVLLFSTLVSASHIPICVETTKDQLNIRMEPNTYSEILTVVEQKGTLLYPVAKSADNWYKVEFSNGYVNGIYGYVYKDYISESGTLKSSVTLLPGAALRTQPQDSAPIQKMLSTGTEISVSGVDTTGNWYYVTSFNGESGYIKKSSVASVDAESYPIAKRSAPEVQDISLLIMESENGNVRESASTGSEKLGTISKGTLITSLGTVKGTDQLDWYKISFSGGLVGYVRSDIVSVYPVADLRGKTIVIDPGHGCYTSAANMVADKFDDGNIGVSGSLEKDINLSIARYLQAYLVKTGANVIMTRETDVGVMSLGKRGEIANIEKADILVSIHINYSTKDAAKRGVITYYWPADSNDDSAELARLVQDASAVELGAENLGIGEERFTVLTASTMPSALVELGFMSNVEDEALLLDDNYRLLCAQGVYKGILKYFE